MDKANSQVMNEENQTPNLCSIPPESKARRGGRICCWERTQPNVLQSINFTKDYTLYLFFTLVISLHEVVTLLEYQYCHYIIISFVRIYQIIKVC